MLTELSPFNDATCPYCGLLAMIGFAYFLTVLVDCVQLYTVPAANLYHTIGLRHMHCRGVAIDA
jgi:hypothetical protein